MTTFYRHDKKHRERGQKIVVSGYDSITTAAEFRDTPAGREAYQFFLDGLEASGRNEIIDRNAHWAAVFGEDQ